SASQSVSSQSVSLQPPQPPASAYLQSVSQSASQSVSVCVSQPVVKKVSQSLHSWGQPGPLTVSLNSRQSAHSQSVCVSRQPTVSQLSRQSAHSQSASVSRQFHSRQPQPPTVSQPPTCQPPPSLHSQSASQPAACSQLTAVSRSPAGAGAAHSQSGHSWGSQSVSSASQPLSQLGSAHSQAGAHSQSAHSQSVNLQSAHSQSAHSQSVNLQLTEATALILPPPLPVISGGAEEAEGGFTSHNNMTNYATVCLQDQPGSRGRGLPSPTRVSITCAAGRFGRCDPDLHSHALLPASIYLRPCCRLPLIRCVSVLQDGDHDLEIFRPCTAALSIKLLRLDTWTRPRPSSRHWTPVIEAEHTLRGTEHTHQTESHSVSVGDAMHHLSRPVSELLINEGNGPVHRTLPQLRSWPLLPVFQAWDDARLV
ncbi:ATP-dependent RNA helicase A isoform X1, partial [Lates japonicus]